MKIFKSGGEIMMEYINIFGAIFQEHGLAGGQMRLLQYI